MYQDRTYLEVVFFSFIFLLGPKGTGGIISAYCKFGSFREVLFSRNFSHAKFRENKIIAKWRNHSVVYYLPMSGSRNFRQGGPGQSDKKKALTLFFLVLSLFYRSQEGVQHFPGGGGGPIAYSL